MKQLLKSIVLSASMLGASGCSHYKPGPPTIVQPSELQKSIGPGRIVSHYQGRSDFTVALIPNMHNSFECQKNVYLTLEALKDQSRFIAREWIGFHDSKSVGSFHWGFSGPFYSRTPQGSQTRKMLGNIEEFVKLPREKRISSVNQWLQQETFPEGTKVGFPMKAPYLLEAVYQDGVQCIGVGDLSTHRRAAIAVSLYNQGKMHFNTFTSEVLNPRNESFVKNIQAVSQRSRKGTFVPFSVGVYHIPGLKTLLQKEKVSYIVIQNQDCLPKK